MARFESRELNVYLRILGSRFADPEQHLPGRIVLSVCSEGACQGKPVGSVVAIDRRGATQRLDGRFGLAAGEMMLTGVVPGGCVAKPMGAIRTSRSARQHETDHDERAQDDQHHDLPMDERGFGRSVARLAMPINQRPAAPSA